MTINPGYDGWVTVRAAAILLGCSTRTVWRLVKSAGLNTGKQKTNTLVFMPDMWKAHLAAPPMGNPRHASTQVDMS